jgi:predicted unusual protein kinase regulating ubiquinone biosynthesis (AarF/ABC1/UbiB family)
MSLPTDLKSLYQIDDDQWLEETIKLLKAQQFEQLDLENLIEELENLGKRDKLSIESLLEQIIRHLLLLEYWIDEYEYNSNHWKAEIMSFREQLTDYLTTNLKNHLNNNLEKIYQKSLRYVKQKTGFSLHFPEQCPYDLEQLLDIHWLP